MKLGVLEMLNPKHRCETAKDAYMSLTEYAIKRLNLPNVAMYLDAGHAGWLGWYVQLPFLTHPTHISTNIRDETRRY